MLLKSVEAMFPPVQIKLKVGEMNVQSLDYDPVKRIVVQKTFDPANIAAGTIITEVNLYNAAFFHVKVDTVLS